MTDPYIGESDRGDTLADIDRALGPALEPLIKRLCPGKDRQEREQIRKDIVEFIGDFVAEPLDLVPADATEAHP